MKLFIFFMISTVATVHSGFRSAPFDVEESHFAYQLKTFRESLDECAEYLEVSKDVVNRLVAHNYVTPEKELKCLIRCAGVNSGWWNDTIGIQGPVIESYFQPAADDTCYVRRTKECINSKLAVCQDDCSKAYEAFLCYYHQWGNLKCSEQYIPLTNLEQIQSAVDCINILRTPANLLEQFIQGVVPDVPETRCLYRCQYMAEGIYDQATGFNLPRLYARESKVPSPEILADSTKTCIENALRGSCDECTRFWRAKKCVCGLEVPNQTADVLKNAAAIILGQKPGCIAEEPNPRYNSIPPNPHYTYNN
ncbi:general odorant-binding protein 45-like [Topomyia yanbarensis]|uniref:general odorant-binding protein 45-like n=1 Tax=Topomyia yanbarensis TaxID=2498891 RepID=UPI00273C9A55|nr:general odorant-binding protein 45-like [Topomyia yanbarensis]